MRPGDGAVLEVRADDAGEEPGADDVVRLGAQVHREHAPPQVVVALPAAGDLRRQRRGRPGVHHVGVADEAARLPALRPRRTRGGTSVRRVDRQLRPPRQRSAGRSRGSPSASSGYQTGNGMPKKRCRLDQPVAVQALRPSCRSGAACRPASTGSRCRARPSPRGDPRRARRCGCTTGGSRRSRAACRRSRRSSSSAWSAWARPRGRRTRAAGRPSPRGPRTSSCPASSAYAAAAWSPASHGGVSRLQPAVAADHRADRQLELAPPLDVGEVAERAAHRDAGALVRLGEVMGEDRDLHAEDRARHGAAEQRLVALVVRVGDQRDHRRDQLRPRRLDVDRRSRGRGRRCGGSGPGTPGP